MVYTIVLLVACCISLMYLFIKSSKEFEDRKKKYLEIRDKIIAGGYKDCHYNVLISDMQGFTLQDRLYLIEIWKKNLEIDNQFDPEQRPQKIQVANRARNQRVESGSVEFTYKDGETDWSGFFLRGDDYFGLRMYLSNLKESLDKKDFDMASFNLSLIQGLLLDDSVLQSGEAQNS